MPIYIVRMDHPDGDGWNKYVVPHVQYLKDLIERGKLIASGPLKGTPQRAGFLIFNAKNRVELDKMIEDDPFSIENLICDLSVAEWDPLFGGLSEYSSGIAPAGLEREV